MRTVVILSCLMACEPEPAPPAAGTCDLIEGETPSLDVSHYSEFGDAPEIVYCGIPPQGGAPYAPFGVRLRGVEPDDLGVNLILTAVDLDTGEEIGVAEYNQVMICSNVCNNAGYSVGAELHMLDANHMSVVEASEQVNTLLLRHLRRSQKAWAGRQSRWRAVWSSAWWGGGERAGVPA